jgi:putative DNA primase/helicase
MNGPVENVLAVLEGVVGQNGYYMALCPAHDDREQSLSVKEGGDGRALLHCFGGCDQDRLLAALKVKGIDRRDLFPNGTDEGRMGTHTPPRNPTTVKPLTLDEYAGAKKIPREFLESVRVGEIPNYNGRRALRIPYLGADGEELAVRFRLAMEGEDRFRWRRGSKPVPYGLWRLDGARQAGYAVLVEGESDAHTIWHHGIPAIGIPGARTWRTAWAEHLEGIEKVYVVVEPDAAGERLWERIAATPALRERLYRVVLGDYKDASEMHIADPERFPERFAAALRGATSFMDIAESEAKEEARGAWAACEELANERRILERCAEDLKRCGVAGESKAGSLSTSPSTAVTSISSSS